MEDEDDHRGANGIPQASSRQRNLSLITAYVEKQRTILVRIKRDVDKLESFKQSVDLDCEEAFSRILLNGTDEDAESAGIDKDGAPGFEKLSTLADDVNENRCAGIMGTLDWGAFRNGDPSHLGTLPSLQRADTLQPPLTPITPGIEASRPSLSSFIFGSPSSSGLKQKENPLQLRMRELRQQLVMPTLEHAAKYIASFPPDSDDEDKGVSKDSKKPRGRDAGTAQGVRAAANRRRQEVAAAAASTRPRGFGGRFLRKDKGLDDMSLNSHVLHSAEKKAWLESGRPTRTRRPVTRYGSPVPSISSVFTSRSATASRSGRVSTRETESAVSASPAPVPDTGSRMRLTIRIPTLAALQRRKQTPSAGSKPNASTSALVSQTPSESLGDTSVGTSAFSRSGSYAYADNVYPVDSCFTPVHGECGSITSLPSQLPKMKQEDQSDAMSIDGLSNGAQFDDQKKQDKYGFSYYIGGSVATSSQCNDDDRSSLYGSRDSQWDDPSCDSFGIPSIARPGLQSITVPVTSPENYQVDSSSFRNGARQWTDSEQQRLDELLEEFPDGTRNRWSAISRAMNGTRNPRQIAARVQKMFSKLTRRGCDSAEPSSHILPAG